MEAGLAHGVGYALPLGVAGEVCWLTPRGCGRRGQDLFEFDRHGRGLWSGWEDGNATSRRIKAAGKLDGKQFVVLAAAWFRRDGARLSLWRGSGGVPSQGLRGCGAATG